MKTHHLGLIMNGVTGRMGTNQHLIRSIVAIRQQGGVRLSPDEVIMPEPVLVGRNENKLKALAEAHGLSRYSTDLEACLRDPDNQIYFDSQLTNLRADAVRQAIAARKSIYCEKPTATNTADALALYQEAREVGLKNGVVQDKLFLPGLLKLKYLIDTGFFGRILSVRGEFGYWVFDGFHQPTQRPSWNYKKEEGGGMILDMFPHWQYVVENLFGSIKALSCLAATHIDKRIDEKGHEYTCTADDAAYATFELGNGVICQFNSSWSVRVRRDDLLTIQVDGTRGSAVAGLRDCVIQHHSFTPKPVWNPDIDSPIDFFETWQRVPTNQIYDNAFKIQWELFLKHVVKDIPFPWTLLEGAKGVQLAELGLQAWQERCWLDVPELVV
ncbi:MAG TPA: Gfo/Idh/MocA family oxidoreductase [Anaerolineae bacterium]|nr:Gfo/Idh/MocA family oxidoreductase [Anaerolineae bacterium]HMR64178.1 Gfo/Idh/MocA family oxidoreductase [Anaerolineae bacterium]